MPPASVDPKVPRAQVEASPTGRTGRAIAWSSFLFAFLQSVCTFVAAASGLRLVIGIGSLAAGSSLLRLLDQFHVDWIRIPMMVFALAGSLLNLAVLWQIRRLRANSAAAWRARPVTPAKLRMERFQILLSLVTLALVAVEEYWHFTWHHHV